MQGPCPGLPRGVSGDHRLRWLLSKVGRWVLVRTWGHFLDAAPADVWLVPARVCARGTEDTRGWHA